MIEKLFESLDEKVFTSELKASLTESFNEAVETKAKAITEAEITKLSEQAEEFKIALAEEAQELQEEKEEALLEQIDLYLEKVVADFVSEAKEQLEGNLVNERADLMIEAFDSVLLAGAVDVAKVVELKESTEVETKLAESIEKYDALVEETIQLEKENSKLIQMGVIAEMSSDLSIVEAEKFSKLASIVEFTKDESYAEKLTLIKENVQSTKVEDSISENLNENVKKKDYSHLV